MKKQQNAAGKLNVSVDAVQNAVNALVMLQVEAIRSNVRFSPVSNDPSSDLSFIADIRK